MVSEKRNAIRALKDGNLLKYNVCVCAWVGLHVWTCALRKGRESHGNR